MKIKDGLTLQILDTISIFSKNQFNQRIEGENRIGRLTLASSLLAEPKSQRRKKRKRGKKSEEGTKEVKMIGSE